MYDIVRTMKTSFFSLRSFAVSRLASRLSFSTNPVSSRPSTIYLTLNCRQLSTMPPPPPKRKWPRRNGGDRPNGASTVGAPTTPRSSAAQQPKRPKVEDALQRPVDTVDVRQLYSTAAGDAAPKPFSDLKDRLHKGLLDGLERMGFE